MRLFVGRVVRASSLWFFAIGLSVVAGASGLQPAYAVDAQVNVAIAGSTAPDMQLEGSTSVVSSMPIILTGRVSNLTQVRVLVDGIYTATIPLTPSDTSFSYSLWVSAGAHIVKFIGISAYTSTNVEQVVSVNYAPPPSTDTGSSGGGSQNPSTINSGSSSHTNGIIIGNSSGEDIPTPPSSPNGIPSVPQWIIQLLVPLDLVNPARVDETSHTLGRFFLFGFGLALLVLTRPILLLYHYVRYRLVGWRKRPLPLFLRRSPLLSLRIIGALLLVAAFFWL